MNHVKTIDMPATEPGMAFGYKVADAIGASFADGGDRILALWGCGEAVRRKLRSESLSWVKEAAPKLARIELNYTKEFNEDGIINLALDTLTLITVSGDGCSFGYFEEVDEAAELEAMDDYRIRVAEEGDLDQEDVRWHWIGEKYGVDDWPAFWQVLWLMFENDQKDTGPIVVREVS